MEIHLHYKQYYDYGASKMSLPVNQNSIIAHKYSWCNDNINYGGELMFDGCMSL